MAAQDRPVWNPPEAPAFEPAPATSEVVSSAGPRRSRIGTGIAIAAIGIGALGVAGTAYASSTSPSPSPSDGRPAAGQNGPEGGQAAPGPGGGMMRGDGDRHLRGGPGKGAGMGLALHGTFVTPKPGGGYQTVDTQQGTVTSVSSTSITVTSVDRFVQTYTVTSTTMVDAQRDGIASVKVGDEVGVMAVESGTDRTAVRIVDRTQLGSMRGQFGPRPDGSASPAPTKTA